MQFAELDCKQREVVSAVLHCDLRRILVLGGPGTGKTATALWTARAHLETSSRTPTQRVLFLTFSRSAVSQLVSRLPGVLSGYEDRVEILTFHALAHRLLRAFGRYAGYGTTIPPVQSVAHGKLLGYDHNQLQYDHFIPKVLKILEGSDRIRKLFSQRWGLVICDEAQDTSKDQWRFLQVLASRKLLLLGDVNQMIYTFRPGISPEQFYQMKNWVDQEIELSQRSYRAPSGAIPALAEAIRQRQFGSEAVMGALRNDHLAIHVNTNNERVTDLLCKVIENERKRGSREIGIFSQTNAAVAEIAKELDASGVNYTLVGMQEAHAAALNSMATQCAFAMGLATDEQVRESLGVFLTARERSKYIPAEAVALAGRGTLPLSLEKAIQKQQGALTNALEGTMEELTEVAMQFGESRPWRWAAAHFQRLAKPLSQLPVSDESVYKLLYTVERSCGEALIDLTYSEQGMVKLMNYHQTKGREVDTVVLVFRPDDFKKAREPYEEESRLLNVAISRARRRVVVILPPIPPRLVKPLTVLTEVRT